MENGLTPYTIDQCVRTSAEAFNCPTDYRIEEKGVVMWPISGSVNPEIDLRKLRLIFDDDSLIIVCHFPSEPQMAAGAYGDVEGESVFVDLYLMEPSHRQTSLAGGTPAG